jgi:23S rRNA (cytosine1962-C5)-methyltransferase
MVTLPKLSIRKGREWQLQKGHPWLFSGAISQAPKTVAAGDLVDLIDVNGRFVARGYYNPTSDIAVRVLTRDPDESIDKTFLRHRVRDAIALREAALNPDQTNVYRLINAEGDFLPGIVADKFADVIVVQSHTAGADRLLPELLGILAEETQSKTIILRNDALVRKREGLNQESAKVVVGDPSNDLTQVSVRENGLIFKVALVSGQKTGFFADQREKRFAVMQYARNLGPNAVLANVFSYSAAFSVYALSGNLRLNTVNVDESAKALELARANFAANELSLANQGFVEADAFKWLEEQARNERRFQLMILDPPAFAKSHKDKSKALKAYQRLNFLGLTCCDSEALLLTCSCSGAISLDEFVTCLRNAAAEANRLIQILSVFKNSADHPVNVAAPETEYLKVLLCRILPLS